MASQGDQEWGRKTRQPANECGGHQVEGFRIVGRETKQVIETTSELPGALQEYLDQDRQVSGHDVALDGRMPSGARRPPAGTPRAPPSPWVAFVVNLVGRTSTPLTIGYNISGTAQVLELFARQLVLPAGVDQARILLVPEADERVEGVETVIIRLLPGAGYGLGTGIEAVLSIIEVVAAGG